MKVIPNFLDQKIFNDIKSNILNTSFPWYFSPTTGHDNDYSDFLFSHYLYKEDKQCSPFFNYILTPLISRLNFNYLLRAKINLYTKKHKEIKTEFHVDSYEKHTVALFIPCPVFLSRTVPLNTPANEIDFKNINIIKWKDMIIFAI